MTEKSYWVRFISPGQDPRPLTVPAPCEWWCSGHGPNDSVICALVRCVDDFNIALLRKWWPGATLSSCDEVDNEWRPGDRFPPKPQSEIGWRSAVLGQAHKVGER